jgi:hypothetical protein
MTIINYVLSGWVIPVHVVMEIGQFVAYVPRQTHRANVLVRPVRFLFRAIIIIIIIPYYSLFIYNIITNDCGGERGP